MNYYITSDDKLTVKLVAYDPLEEEILKAFVKGEINLNLDGRGGFIASTPSVKPDQTKH